MAYLREAGLKVTSMKEIVLLAERNNQSTKTPLFQFNVPNVTVDDTLQKGRVVQYESTISLNVNVKC